MSDDKNKSIDEILKSYSQERNSQNTDDRLKELNPDEAISPPNEEIEEQKDNEAKRKKLKINMKIFKKAALIFVSVIAAAGIITGSVFGIKKGIEYSKVAYLKPYQEKYPDTKFPSGILEEYCEEYGKNPNLQGCLKIPDLENKMIYLTADNTAPLKDGAERFNYTVYLDSKELEKHYKNAETYNSSKQFFTFSDLFSNYTFHVVGAFYTNTNPADDDGYIFPYNTTEKMTDKSFNNYFDRLKNRFIYTVDGMNVSQKNTLLTISSPTDYKEDYRFVVVAKLVDEADNQRIARDKKERRLTASEYKDKKTENPYELAGNWYPEILVKDSNGTEKTIQKTIDDYK